MTDITSFRADLHCHTNCSDGTVSPPDIIKLAHERKLNGLSITDHDTIEAYKTALPVAAQYNIPLVSGVEFSAVSQTTSVHILAYSFSLHSPIIQQFCHKHHEQRLERNRKILFLLKKQGMSIDEQELESIHSPSPHSTIGRPHIAMIMVKKGYVTSIQEAFNKYIGENGPCYALGNYFSVEETIDVIHQANGFAIIAHPHLIRETELLNQLLDMPFDGIEGYYGNFPSTEQQRWIQIGQRKDWIITGGSDFHGEIKPSLPLGSSWIGQETFQFLQERFRQNESP